MTNALRWTSADLELLTDDGKRYEIIDGEHYIEIYRREQAALRLIETLFEQDVLQSPLLPGFTCQIRQLFVGIS
ncbi:MAG TPA: hypothetical protein VKE41_22225 [Roseiflexaceae bacterium]|nr:hypothetical protein [Roseiflexaceae bacterium]